MKLYNSIILEMYYKYDLYHPDNYYRVKLANMEKQKVNLIKNIFLYSLIQFKD